MVVEWQHFPSCDGGHRRLWLIMTLTQRLIASTRLQLSIVLPPAMARNPRFTDKYRSKCRWGAPHKRRLHEIQVLRLRSDVVPPLCI